MYSMSQTKTQYNRILFIDNKIRSGRYPNCATMAREWEVHQRTISRDIEYMRDMFGAPIEYSKKERGYFYTEEGYNLPAISIPESDLFALFLAEKALALYENTPLYETLESTFNRLKSFLPEEITLKSTWAGSRFTFLPESRTNIIPEIWENCATSLRREVQLRIRHTRPGSREPTRRAIEPYHMISFRGEWYLIALDHRSEEIRIFAISRIDRADLTEVRFQVPDGFNLEEYLGNHFGILTGEEEYQVRILFSPSQAPYVTERRWTDDQELDRQDDGSVILGFRTNSLFEVQRWVLSWGGDAKVLEPEALVLNIRRELKQTLDHYS